MIKINPTDFNFMFEIENYFFKKAENKTSIKSLNLFYKRK